MTTQILLYHSFLIRFVWKYESLRMRKFLLLLLLSIESSRQNIFPILLCIGNYFQEKRSIFEKFNNVLNHVEILQYIPVLKKWILEFNLFAVIKKKWIQDELYILCIFFILITHSSNRHERIEQSYLKNSIQPREKTEKQVLKLRLPNNTYSFSDFANVPLRSRISRVFHSAISYRSILTWTLKQSERPTQ